MRRRLYKTRDGRTDLQLVVVIVVVCGTVLVIVDVLLVPFFLNRQNSITARATCRNARNPHRKLQIPSLSTRLL